MWRVSSVSEQKVSQKFSLNFISTDDGSDRMVTNVKRLIYDMTLIYRLPNLSIYRTPMMENDFGQKRTVFFKHRIVNCIQHFKLFIHYSPWKTLKIFWKERMVALQVL